MPHRPLIGTRRYRIGIFFLFIAKQDKTIKYFGIYLPYEQKVRIMREPIPYLQWKERIDAHTPGNRRVGNDFLIVK